jgi:hypothetical protein
VPALCLQAMLLLLLLLLLLLSAKFDHKPGDN